MTIRLKRGIDPTVKNTQSAVTAEQLSPPAPPRLQARLEAGEAIAWSEPVKIRTYEPEPPADFPMYLDHRVYQGSSGRVYPLPFIERISSEPDERTWQAIHLENRYLRLMVLPELGGRIHIGFDKTTGYDFFYRNSVIKPALVGLTGPWISGGVEFNWPQHHRPATYLAVETRIEEHADGSVTVWCSDHDPFARMAATHGIRLHPNRAVVEVVVRLHNRTSERQTFLWWANAAVAVHDDYQSFFPQDVRYVADHARRAITAFPAADRPYYGVDYPARAAVRPGADRIDFYRNIPVPTSYMVVDSEDSFFGGYDHAAGAGVVHTADRRIAPGKKQWTWGNSPFGRAWDNLLTDSDGPYVELMAGVYTDNQPDFSWLAPGEVKRFSQFWYPIPAIGIAHAANADAAVHVEIADEVIARIAVTRPMTAVLRILNTTGEVLGEQVAELAPGIPTGLSTPIPAGLGQDRIRVELVENGDLVLEWHFAERDNAEPWVATEPPCPKAITSVEELYLTGVHLAQYRHPTRSPLPYWREALRRDPGESRVHLALAETTFRAGDYQQALQHARASVARIAVRNENPRDAESYYLLGVILERVGADAESLRWLAKAAWDGSWKVAAGFEAARILARNGMTVQADADLEELNRSYPDDSRVSALRAVVLRRLARADEADRVLRDARAATPIGDLLDFLAIGARPSDGGLLLDLAVDLAAMGEVEDALDLLSQAATSEISPGGNVRPIAHYLRASLLDAAGRSVEARAERANARSAEHHWCFPAGLDAHDALTAALAAEPEDDAAASLLGMLLYGAGRRHEAMRLWGAALARGAQDPVLSRNAGLGSYNVLGDDYAAWRHYEAARALAPDNARLLFEQDQLAARLGHPNEDRLARLEALPALVSSRDDLVVELAGLLTRAHRAADALVRLESRTFQPWEGGEGRVLAAWDQARDALGLPQAAPPASLGEGRPEVAPPAPLRGDGTADYFATSLPELLLFTRYSDESEPFEFDFEPQTATATATRNDPDPLPEPAEQRP